MDFHSNPSDINQFRNEFVQQINQEGENNLEELFDSVLKPDSHKPSQVPLRKRKLPQSFFNPSASGLKLYSSQNSSENSLDSAFGSRSHSKENSIDSASGSIVSITNPRYDTVFQVTHIKAHSLPASLEETYAAGQSIDQNFTLHQTRQLSDNTVCTMAEEQTPLPPGWSQAFTSDGQIYFLDHVTRTSTWEDPRKILKLQMQTQMSTDNRPKPYRRGSEGREQTLTSECDVCFPYCSSLDPQKSVHPQQEHVYEMDMKYRLQALKLEKILKNRQQPQSGQMFCEVGESSHLSENPFFLGVVDQPRSEISNVSSSYVKPYTSTNIINNMDCSYGSVDNLNGRSLNSGISYAGCLVPSLKMDDEFSSDILLDDIQSLIDEHTNKMEEEN